MTCFLSFFSSIRHIRTLRSMAAPAAAPAAAPVIVFPQEQNNPAQWVIAATHANISLPDLVVYINALRHRETRLHHLNAKLGLAMSVLLMYQSNPPDEALRKFCSCVDTKCGLTVVVDDVYGQMLPCGHHMHTACMREHKACPVCKTPYGDVTILPTVLLAMSEVMLAANILRAGENLGRTLARYRESFADVAPNKMQPLRALVVGNGSTEDIVAMARTLATAERARLQASATDIVRRLTAELTNPNPFPMPNRTAPAPARAAHAPPASPVKRPVAAKPVSHAPSDLRTDTAMPENAVLPAPPDGKNHKYNGIVIIPSKFRGKCPGCNQEKMQNLTLVSPREVPGKPAQWVCAMCAHGVTSEDIYNSIVGSGNPEDEFADLELDASDLC